MAGRGEKIFRGGKALMQIKVEKNVGGIEGLCVIEPTVHGDSRGYFMETYSQRDMEEAGLNYTFVQDNQSMSTKVSFVGFIEFVQTVPHHFCCIWKICASYLWTFMPSIRSGEDVIVYVVALIYGYNQFSRSVSLLGECCAVED